MLNNQAREVVEQMRDRHPTYVFAYQRARTRSPGVYAKPQTAPRRIETMNNTAWQNARRHAARKYREKLGRDAPWGFAHVRVHDLKHTFGRRLRAAAVPEETRAVLLGHKTRSMPTHYSVAELGELLCAVNRIDRSLATPAIALLHEEATQNSRRK